MTAGAAVAGEDRRAALAEQSAARLAAKGKVRPSDLRAEGEPSTWLLGGALSFGILMILGLLLLTQVRMPAMARVKRG